MFLWRPKAKGPNPKGFEPQSLKPNAHLPVQFQRKLELPRIIRSARLSGVLEERADSGHIVLVRDVEHVSDQVHVEALPDVNTLCDPQIAKGRPRGAACVAAQVTIQRLEGDEWEGRGGQRTRSKSLITRLLNDTCG